MTIGPKSGRLMMRVKIAKIIAYMFITLVGLLLLFGLVKILILGWLYLDLIILGVVGAAVLFYWALSVLDQN